MEATRQRWHRDDECPRETASARGDLGVWTTHLHTQACSGGSGLRRRFSRQDTSDPLSERPACFDACDLSGERLRPPDDEDG